MPESPPSQLTGNLTTMNLADLLQWVSLGNKTGTLHLENGPVSKEIYFREGQLISAGSNTTHDLLGEFLVHHRRITEEDLSRALDQQKSSGANLGSIIMEMDLLSQDELVRILQVKAEETIYELFLWDEGTFHFVSGRLPERELIPVSVDLTGLIMEGVRRADEIGLIRQTLPTNNVLLRVPESRRAEVDQLIGFDRQLIQFILNGQSLDAISSVSRSPEFILLKRVHEFLEQGLLEIDHFIEEKKESEPGQEETPTTAGGIGTEHTARDLVAELRQSLQRGDADAALHGMRLLRAQLPEDSADRAALPDLERAAVALIQSKVIDPASYPVLIRNTMDLLGLTLSPNEAFLVFRIDGTMTVREIIQISPMGEVDALLILKRLVDDGIIELSETGEIKPFRE